MRPKVISLFCVALLIMFLTRIGTALLLSFFLVSPVELASTGIIVEISLDLLAIVALIGIFQLRWWGVILFAVISVTHIVLCLFSVVVPVFSLLVAAAVIILLISVVLPNRACFS